MWSPEFDDPSRTTFVVAGPGGVLMWGVLTQGAVVARDCWPVAVVLWLVNLAFGATFAFLSGSWLYFALDGSLATRTLLWDLDPNVLVDLFVHHGEGMLLLLVVALLMTAAYVLIWLGLHAVIVFAVRGFPDCTFKEAWRRGWQATWLMARIYPLAALMMILFSAAVGTGVWGMFSWTISSPAGLLWSGILGVALAVWGAGVLFLSAVHDHARIRACAYDEGALAAYRWAFRFVLRGGRRAYLLAVALAAIGIVFWFAFHAVTHGLPTDGLIGVGGSLVLGVSFMLARMWLRVWVFATESQLQR